MSRMQTRVCSVVLHKGRGPNGHMAKAVKYCVASENFAALTLGGTNAQLADRKDHEVRCFFRCIS